MSRGDPVKRLDDGQLCFSPFEHPHAEQNSRRLGNVEHLACRAAVPWRGGVESGHVNAIRNDDAAALAPDGRIQRTRRLGHKNQHVRLVECGGSRGSDHRISVAIPKVHVQQECLGVAFMDRPYRRDLQPGRDMDSWESDNGVGEDCGDLLVAHPGDELGHAVVVHGRVAQRPGRREMNLDAFGFQLGSERTIAHADHQESEQPLPL
jgi:hypothetical protein